MCGKIGTPHKSGVETGSDIAVEKKNNGGLNECGPFVFIEMTLWGSLK